MHSNPSVEFSGRCVFIYIYIYIYIYNITHTDLHTFNFPVYLKVVSGVYYKQIWSDVTDSKILSLFVNFSVTHVKIEPNLYCVC